MCGIEATFQECYIRKICRILVIQKFSLILKTEGINFFLSFFHYFGCMSVNLSHDITL